MTSTPFARLGLRRMFALLMTVSLLSAAVFGQSPATVPNATLSAAEKSASASVRVETIREIVTALTAKEMEGRGTAQAGGDRAAKYIADRFARIGLKPLGDAGTYLQAIKFRVAQPLFETSFTAGDASLKFGTDFVASPPFNAELSEASGGLVFVTYGVVAPDLKRDDLAGIDVKGKIVILLSGRPKNIDDATWRKAVNPQGIFVNLFGRGAAAVVLGNIGSKERPFSLIGNYLSRRRVARAETPEAPFKTPPVILAGDTGLEKLFAGTGTTYAELLAKAEAGETVSRELNKQASISVRIKKEESSGSNVVGYIEGSDPKLKEEAIVYTAHYDAYGIDSKGVIFPGAADNALGVGEILSIAEAFSKLKSRRSVIFLAVTGEEHGLLGAEHWVAHPTWPLEKIAADLNYDGIGTEVYAPVKRIVGFGAEYSDLGPLMEAVVTANGGQVGPDPLPEERAFYRSDHYAFVKQGVPALMLLGGPEGEITPWIDRAKKWMATDYHQPTDTIGANWNWDGARTVAVIGLVIGMRVANADAMPAWIKGSQFDKPRGAAAKPAAPRAN